MLVVHLILALVILQGLHKPHCVAGQKQTKLSSLWMRGRFDGQADNMCRPDDVAVVIFTADQNLNNLTIITTGAFISPTRVITSYNAFRDIIEDDAWSAYNTRIAYIDGIYIYEIRDQESRSSRRRRRPEEVITESHERVTCGRQVIPLIGNNVSKVFYLDANKRYSPTHDLMVFRVEVAKLVETEMDSESNVCFHKIRENHSWLSTNRTNTHALIGLHLAYPMTDILELEKLTIVGLDLRDTKYNTLNKLHAIDVTTDAVVDCDNWIPREWGYFICIQNYMDLRVLTSGSVLYYKGFLYGIGSFKLSRNGQDILVFTDVRPYRPQILRVCSKSEFKPSYPSDAWW